MGRWSFGFKLLFNPLPRISTSDLDSETFFDDTAKTDDDGVPAERSWTRRKGKVLSSAMGGFVMRPRLSLGEFLDED